MGGREVRASSSPSVDAPPGPARVSRGLTSAYTRRGAAVGFRTAGTTRWRLGRPCWPSRIPAAYAGSLGGLSGSFGSGRAATKPPSKVCLLGFAISKSQHRGDHLWLRRVELPTIEHQEDDHRHERQPLVPIPKGMILAEAEAIGSSQRGDVAGRLMRPALLGPSQRELERVLVADPSQAAMGPNLIQMDCIHHNPRDPDGLSAHLLAQLPQSVPIPLAHGRRGGQSGLY